MSINARLIVHDMQFNNWDRVIPVEEEKMLNMTRKYLNHIPSTINERHMRKGDLNKYRLFNDLSLLWNIYE